MFRGVPRRRLVLGGIIGLFLLTLIATGLTYLGRNQVYDAAIRRQRSVVPDDSFTADDGRVRVLLCGTGSPEISDARAQACTMVAAGGRTFLFDVGDGSTKSLHESGVDVAGIDKVFLTHFHSDHFNGLGMLVNSGWIWGREEPLPVAGPPGVVEVVDGLDAAYSLDRGYRTSHMDGVQRSEDAQAEAEGFTIPEGEDSVVVHDQDGVRIEAVRVDHEPVEPAYGYVLTYAGKKVFVSGDTKVTPETMPAMRDADIVVHEAYATHMVRRAVPIMRELGQAHDADVAERTMSYHADTIELAEQAEKADVEHLVLTHLTPYPSNVVARHWFTEGMADRFHGELTLGEDGMVITI